MSLSRFKRLSAAKQALVAMAVLLDGREAVNYLGNDSLLGSSLQRAVEEFTSFEPELRMPLAATLLRQAISELENIDSGQRSISEKGSA